MTDLFCYARMGGPGYALFRRDGVRLGEWIVLPKPLLELVRALESGGDGLSATTAPVRRVVGGWTVVAVWSAVQQEACVWLAPSVASITDVLEEARRAFPMVCDRFCQDQPRPQALSVVSVDSSEPSQFCGHL